MLWDIEKDVCQTKTISLKSGTGVVVSGNNCVQVSSITCGDTTYCLGATMTQSDIDVLQDKVKKTLKHIVQAMDAQVHTCGQLDLNYLEQLIDNEL